ncbi:MULTISPECIES: DUF1254 domain-containing protein [unclassified Rhodococcus (in: high G+C Gram-positive bacteria)]|uniref:DUF1254 domain-containing protein n=1 Tax=unclassified Rhodococcus (in: high G+C Gram-positive bacteria) TaxID=192944 RepID=UPI00163B09D3|nr:MULTISPECIES: DUF1254 domain-containing protein [unclassified Rhodococcus (in: high G+C Gram-positive bacteria)]MBC2641583.1 DUF1254 domain-containing protein [Rhodococcus sp. 3A]MBC2893672.1 DUF1254 domain-containing protein [Rhodococcus sp. 4CII]
MSAELQELAAKAWVYGFPLVFDLDQVNRFVAEGMGSLDAAPFNTFSHARTLAGPQDTFVSVNNDTIYSIAQLDLAHGPQLLRVPDSGGAYYVLQFVDAWTNNFAYVGKRATGTGAGRYLLTCPEWSGEVPAGATRIACPTAAATIVGRWACDGEDDLGRVRQLQSALTLEPVGDQDPAEGLPAPDPNVPDELRFWEKLRVYSQAYPPAPRDLVVQQAFAPLGLLETGSSPYLEAPPDLASMLTAGAEAGHRSLDTALKSGAGGTVVNGWQPMYHAFDYNDDFFEVGTLDSPEWRIADRSRALGMRAGAARAGLWGNHGYEAAYAPVYHDSDGNELSGEHTYTLTFAQTPPVDAFWSITMYDLPDFFLVDNPLDRYSIGDRTPGLVFADDGSLTITLGAAAPADPAARANWLPTPDGGFRPLLRMYSPKPQVFDGTFEIPPFVRTT